MVKYIMLFFILFFSRYIRNFLFHHSHYVTKGSLNLSIGQFWPLYDVK